MHLGIDFGTCFSSTAVVDDSDVVVTDGLLMQDTSGTGMPSIFLDDGIDEFIGFDVLEHPERFDFIVVRQLKRAIRKKVEKPEAERADKDDKYVDPVLVEETVYDDGAGKVNKKKRGEILSDMLGKLVSDTLAAAATKFPNSPVESVTVTVPCGLNAAAITSTMYRTTIKEAVLRTMKAYLEAIKEGVRVGSSCGDWSVPEDKIFIIDEPVAAALAFIKSTPAADDQTIMVLDIGGGTSDVALVNYSRAGGEDNFRVITSDGDLELGGEDWDAELKRLLISKLAKEKQYIYADQSDSDKHEFDERVTKFKISLSRCADRNDLPRNPFITPSSKIKIQCTRGEFEDATAGLRKRLAALVDHVLACERGTKIDRVVLVGGGSNMPQVTDLIKSRLPDVPVKIYEPSKAIAMGAARYSKLHETVKIDFDWYATASYGFETFKNGSADHYIKNVIYKDDAIKGTAQYLCYDSRPGNNYLRPSKMHRKAFKIKLYESDFRRPAGSSDGQFIMLEPNKSRFNDMGLEVMVNVPSEYVIPYGDPRHKDAPGTYHVFPVVKLSRDGILRIEVWVEMLYGEDAGMLETETVGRRKFKLVKSNEKKI